MPRAGTFRSDRIARQFADRRVSCRRALTKGHAGLVAGALAAAGIGAASAQDATPAASEAGPNDLAGLVSNARISIAELSAHNIHQDQPELVIEAIRHVVEAVRDPGAWTA